MISPYEESWCDYKHDKIRYFVISIEWQVIRVLNYDITI